MRACVVALSGQASGEAPTVCAWFDSTLAHCPERPGVVAMSEHERQAIEKANETVEVSLELTKYGAALLLAGVSRLEKNRGVRSDCVELSDHISREYEEEGIAQDVKLVSNFLGQIPLHDAEVTPDE